MSMAQYKIIATAEQLDEIGISYDLTGVIGTLKREFNDGYVELTVVHRVGSHEFTNDFDIPESYLEKITE
jgi:hypothetical protein